MHNDSLDFVVKSIENSLLIEKNNIIYQKYQNFLDDALVNRINSEIDSLKRCKLQNQTALTRERADYDQKLLKELKIIFSHSSIKQALEKKYKIQLKIGSVDLWFDSAGYFLPPHVDDRSISLSLHIYLGKDRQPGTTLYQNVNDIEYFDIFPYKFNCGYSMLNTNTSYHGLEYKVTGGLRKSLYIRFI